jgi:hypothetical protein
VGGEGAELVLEKEGDDEGQPGHQQGRHQGHHQEQEQRPQAVHVCQRRKQYMYSAIYRFIDDERINFSAVFAIITVKILCSICMYIGW